MHQKYKLSKIKKFRLENIVKIMREDGLAESIIQKKLEHYILVLDNPNFQEMNTNKRLIQEINEYRKRYKSKYELSDNLSE